MLAHSLKLVLPRITAPAARNFCATIESFGGLDPTSASDPAVVIMRSTVAMLSLINTGIPCRGPLGPFVLRSRSRSSAMETASGFISIIAFTVRLSMSSMRAVYFSTSDLAVNLPDFIPSCNSEMVISSRSNGFTSAAEDSAAREISRAELNAGRKATVAEATRVVCRNPRRDEPELERMSVQWRSRLNAGRLFKHECPQEFTIPARQRTIKPSKRPISTDKKFVRFTRRILTTVATG